VSDSPIEGAHALPLWMPPQAASNSGPSSPAHNGLLVAQERTAGRERERERETSLPKRGDTRRHLSLLHRNSQTETLSLSLSTWAHFLSDALLGRALKLEISRWSTCLPKRRATSREAAAPLHVPATYASAGCLPLSPAVEASQSAPGTAHQRLPRHNTSHTSASRRTHAHLQRGYKATWKGEFNLQRRKAGLLNRLDDEVNSDQ